MLCKQVHIVLTARVKITFREVWKVRLSIGYTHLQDTWTRDSALPLNWSIIGHFLRNRPSLGQCKVPLKDHQAGCDSVENHQTRFDKFSWLAARSLHLIKRSDGLTNAQRDSPLHVAQCKGDSFVDFLCSAQKAEKWPSGGQTLSHFNQKISLCRPQPPDSKFQTPKDTCFVFTAW